MGMVPTYDVRYTASRYSSCSTLNTTIHAFRPETNEGVSSQPMNDTRVLCLKQTKVTILPKKSPMKIQLQIREKREIREIKEIRDTCSIKQLVKACLYTVVAPTADSQESIVPSL